MVLSQTGSNFEQSTFKCNSTLILPIKPHDQHQRIHRARLQSMAQDPTRRTSLKRKSAPVRTTMARKPHRSAPQRLEIRTKFVVSNLHPQSFVCKSLSSNTCPQNFIPISLSPKSSSTNLCPQNSIQKLKFAELCVQNFANFRSSHIS